MSRQTYEPLTGNLTTRVGCTCTFENWFPVISDDWLSVSLILRCKRKNIKYAGFWKTCNTAVEAVLLWQKTRVSKTLYITPSVYKHVKQLPCNHSGQITAQQKPLSSSSSQFRALMFCPCHHSASPGWWFLLPVKYPSIQTRVSACCQGSPECSGQPWTLEGFLKMSLIETTVSVHRLLPSAVLVQAQKDARRPTLPAAQLQHFQLETDTQVMPQFWSSLWGLMGKQPNESGFQTSSTWSHVAEVTRRSFLVLLPIERVWEKTWMRLWSDALLSLLRIRSDLEDSSLLLSKRPTLCGSVGDAGRTPCCWKMSFMIVGFFFSSTFSEILAALFIFFWLATEEFFQHLSNQKKISMSFWERNAEIYGCTWQLCTILTPLL